MEPLRILLADADPAGRSALSGALARAGHRVHEAGGQEAALLAFRSRDYDLVIVDAALPPDGGVAAIAAVKAIRPSCPVALAARGAEVGTVLAAFRGGAFDVLAPPQEGPALDGLLARVRAAREMGASRRRIEELAARAQAGESDALMRLLGDSAPMRALASTIREVARTDATVLVTGESGTGKGLVARAIHSASARAARPFVEAHCAVYSEGLLQSELFGHEKGAFTGADRVKRGRFEMAQGGTLFLDEIGDLEPGTQLLLLRVLQQRAYERVGGETTLEADVRLIAATHRDLQRAMEEGAFRSDLYYRLNVIPIQLVPLRERREDVPLLATAFLRQAASRLNRPEPVLGAGVVDALEAYAWPGNVRELENLMERLCVLAREGRIEEPDLPVSLRRPVRAILSGGLADLERAAIAEALAATRGNKKLAARRLGLHRSTFYAKLRRHGLAAMPGRPESGHAGVRKPDARSRNR